MHKAQFAILYTLRHCTSARYSQLLRATDLESDTFKFHLRKLIKPGYVHKDASGHYSLTASGKEFANRLDKTQRILQEQPKISLLLVAKRENMTGEAEYLCQQRKRNPYYDFWGCISGPAVRAESFEAMRHTSC